MRRAFALVATAALAACGGANDPAASAPETVQATPPAVAAAPNEPASSGQQIGAVSGLTGQTSALTGAVNDFMVERTATETRVQLAADTLFDFDKATLSPAAQANLQRTADLVREGGAGTVMIVGHSDAKGEDDYNLDLSKRRAEAVATWLRGQPGLDTPQYAAVGRGEAEPIAPNAKPDGSDDPDGRARNRRVVVNIPR